MDYEYELYNRIVDEIINNGLNVVESKHKLSNIITQYSINKIETDCKKCDVSYNIEKYLKDKTIQQLSKSSLSNYKIQLNIFKKYINLININLQQITKDHILSYFEYLKSNKPNLKNSTFETVRYILQVFFTWAKDENIITESPMVRIKPFKVEKRISKSLSVKELEIVRDACTTLRQKALIEVLYSTGLRLSELVKLNIEDIDWQNERIKIIGKGDKERYVFLSIRSIIYLKRYLENRNDNCEALFVTERKNYRRLQNRGVQCEVNKIGVKSGLCNSLTPHCMRHTLLSMLASRECPLPIIKDIAGHDDINTSMRYIHTSPEIKQQAYNKYLYQ